MTTVPMFFGTPEVIGGQIPPTRDRIKHFWKGPGNILPWNLTDHSGQSGVILLADGIDGLHVPEFVQYLDKSETTYGSVLAGIDIPERNVVWSIYVYQGTSEAWVALDRAWWASLRPDEAGVWTAQAPGANPRHLRCILKGSEPSMRRDPASAMWNKYAVTLLACDPFWYEDVDPVEFGFDTPRNFLGGGPLPGPGAGTPLVVSPNARVLSKLVANPGDVETWATFRTDGGAIDAGLAVGVGSRVAVIDRPIPEGSVLTYNTEPRDQIILIDGVEYIPPTRARCAPIPRGQTVGITVAHPGGPGKVLVDVVPRFFRGW